jgi:hypothetical protein
MNGRGFSATLNPFTGLLFSMPSMVSLRVSSGWSVKIRVYGADYYM